MKTNFPEFKNFVLSNDENKIIAIIECVSGLQSIDEKLVQAIKDDEEAEHVFILNQSTITDNGSKTLFKAVVVDFMEDSNTNTYYLTDALTY